MRRNKTHFLLQDVRRRGASSFREERMGFFPISEKEKEDEFQYSGTPYISFDVHPGKIGRRVHREPEKDKLLLRDCLERKREVAGKNFFSFLFTPPHGKFLYGYGVFLASIILILGVIAYGAKGIHIRGSVSGASDEGFYNASTAMQKLKDRDFSASGEQFEKAASLFRSGSEEIVLWSGILSNISIPIPFLSQISSARYALSAGEHLALAGKHMSDLAEVASETKESLNGEISLLEVFQKSIEISDRVRSELALAEDSLQKVRFSDIPAEKREQFLQLKETIPLLLDGFSLIHNNAPAFVDVLGGNGPRNYLFLFQNNQEARATGGFIGSYGLLDMKDGEVRRFFIDGIFNPDGQLKTDIVPPQPIRKVSAAWSLHDSNWFPDFPLSAEKAIVFYEKTGGSTVDGVIAITPTVLKRILEVTGPIDLPNYDATVSAENLIETLQYEVEVDYDKKENKPKKILGDLAPRVLERVFHAKDPESIFGFMNALHSSLREKDILLYSRNESLQTMYRKMGWSGELRDTSRDFLSVVNSNINGFKTDGVIDQTLHHIARIESDGSIVNTVSITRKHNGGDTPYDWWNAVNADYMRVYVPKGAVLLSAKGHTREIVRDPLDYDALRFQRDDLVGAIENTLRVDPVSGTQIFEESGKTVFGNWVYVSPKESVTVEYTYLLPFLAGDPESSSAAYSLLLQKQSGSFPSMFSSRVISPGEWKVDWQSPYNVKDKGKDSSVYYEGDLSTDVFFGAVFQK